MQYKPFPGFSGTDTFTYTITDGGAFSSATVTVTVALQGTANNHFAVYAGPFDGSRWTVSPKGGTGSPSTGGKCNGSPGLSVDDVLLQNPLERHKALDNGLTFWINNQQVTPLLPMIVTHHSLASGPVDVAGVNVTVYYDGLLNSDILRTRVVLANTSGVLKVFTATVASNLGSDASTVLVGTSSGGASFTTADRWLVTSDSLSNPGLIVDTHVLYGPGSPPVVPGKVYNTSFACNEQPIADTHGVRADFGMALADGQVVQLLFFNQAHDSNAQALSDAAVFNTTPVGMLAGISNLDLEQIVNWNIGPISRLYLPLLQH